MKALITGASSGLGKALSQYLSKYNYEVVMIARNKEALVDLQKELLNPSEIIIADLSKHEDVMKVTSFIEKNNIDILVNNAGIGYLGEFWNIPINYEKVMLEVNMIAPTLLMKAYIKTHNVGRIINIASIAACQVDPFMAGYGASKAYLKMLSSSVQIELQHSSKSIMIHTCLPGSFISNFDKQANVKNSLAVISSEVIAEKIMKDVFRNKKIIVPGFKNKCAYYISKIIPEKIMGKIEYKLQKNKK